MSFCKPTQFMNSFTTYIRHRCAFTISINRFRHCTHRNVFSGRPSPRLWSFIPLPSVHTKKATSGFHRRWSPLQFSLARTPHFKQHSKHVQNHTFHLIKFIKNISSKSLHDSLHYPSTCVVLESPNSTKLSALAVSYHQDHK